MAPKKKEDDDDDVSSVEIDDDAEEPEEVRSLGNQKKCGLPVLLCPASMHSLAGTALPDV